MAQSPPPNSLSVFHLHVHRRNSDKDPVAINFLPPPASLSPSTTHIHTLSLLFPSWQSFSLSLEANSDRSSVVCWRQHTPLQWPQKGSTTMGWAWQPPTHSDGGAWNASERVATSSVVAPSFGHFHHRLLVPKSPSWSPRHNGTHRSR